MEKTNKSNHVGVVISLFFIALLAGINASLLRNGYTVYGVYVFLSLGVSSIAFIPALVILFFKSEVGGLTVIKAYIVLTFGSQGFVEESRSISSSTFCNLYFFMNLAVVVLSIVSMVLIHRHHSQSKK